MTAKFLEIIYSKQNC